MATTAVTRRRILRGLGGFSLALPFLPSLEPRPAFGGDPVVPHNKRFVAVATSNGGIWSDNMFPLGRTPQLAETRELYPGHVIGRSPLTRTVKAGRASFSPVLSASDHVLTPKLAGKMNVLRGVDIPFYLAHHTGGHLGNFARNDGNGDEAKAIQGDRRPTIDQVLAWSPSFYQSLGGVKERSAVAGSRTRGLSWNYSNPVEKKGDIQEVKRVDKIHALFDSLIGAPVDPTAPQRKPIADLVREDYLRLRDGNRRLSSADRQRLSDHIDRLDELERRMNVTIDCGSIPRPTKNAQSPSTSKGEFEGTREYYTLLIDVLAAAFACGTTRIATIAAESGFADTSFEWHGQVAHSWDLPDKQELLAASQRNVFEYIVAGLADRLDAIEESPGVSVLDNTLIVWTQECGEATHSSLNIPIVTAGGAGGYFATGQFVDYTNWHPATKLPGVSKGNSPGGFTFPPYAGISFRQYLATVLQSMGLSPAEFERGGIQGYGVDFVSKRYLDVAADPRIYTQCSEPLPFLRA